MDSFEREFGDDRELPVPPFVVLYRDQREDSVTPAIEAMFRDITAAHRYLNMYRPLGEHEFLTLEEVDHERGVATVHSALTAGTMRMVMTDEGPRAMPKEVAAIWGDTCTDPDCSCRDDEKEVDDE